MKIAAVKKPGGLENVEIREADAPAPGPGEIQVRVKASSVPSNSPRQDPG